MTAHSYSYVICLIWKLIALLCGTVENSVEAGCLVKQTLELVCDM